VGLLGTAIASFLVSPAGAAVTIGSDLPGSANGSINCSATCTALTVQRPANPVSSPVDGVIVRWRSRFGESFVGARLRVLSVSGNSVTGIRSGPPTNHPAGLQESSINPGLPISSGEMIGIDLTDPMLANVLRSRPMANLLWRASGVGDGAMAPAASLAGNEVLVNADVEPDCDQDGFGDETQDPSADCEAPDTTITAGPKNKVKTKKKRATVSFEFRVIGARLEPRVQPRRRSIRGLHVAADREGEGEAQSQRARAPRPGDRRRRERRSDPRDRRVQGEAEAPTLSRAASGDPRGRISAALR